MKVHKQSTGGSWILWIAGGLAIFQLVNYVKSRNAPVRLTPAARELVLDPDPAIDLELQDRLDYLERMNQ